MLPVRSFRINCAQTGGGGVGGNSNMYNITQKNHLYCLGLISFLYCSGLISLLFEFRRYSIENVASNCKEIEYHKRV